MLSNWVAVPKDDIGGEGLRLPRGLVVGDELVFSGYVPSKSKKPIGDRSPSDPAPVAARIRLASVDLSSSSTF
jgi:hypothetical protein